jgi:hypothetical protein
MRVHFHIFLLVCCGYVLSACRPHRLAASGDRGLISTANVQLADYQNANGIWEDYLRALTPKTEDRVSCSPMKIDPSETADWRGSILLFHGAGGCPQGLSALGQRLAIRGWRVYMPLVPSVSTNDWGAALRLEKERIDRQENIKNQGDPIASDAPAFRFIELMNRLMSSAPGQRLVAGVGDGATVAAATVTRGEFAYDRLLLIRPSTNLNELRALSPDIFLEIGPHLKSSRMATQIVGLEADVTIHRHRLMKQLNIERPLEGLGVCYLADGINALVSQWENRRAPAPGQEFFRDLDEQALDFLDTGSFFPQLNVAPRRVVFAGVRLCALKAPVVSLSR